MINFILKKQNLILSPKKAIFWKEQKILLIADLHLGKTTHFRLSGIAVPEEIIEKDISQLSELMKDFKPEKVIFLGDLFHSKYNNECEVFKQWRQNYKDVEMILIKGNHDKYKSEIYEEIGVKLLDEMKVSPFTFVHEPVTKSNSNHYYMSGHVHPGVKLHGKGKQSMTLPCFYFGKNQSILPAFGSFTGKSVVTVKSTDKVFVIAENSVIDLNAQV